VNNALTPHNQRGFYGLRQVLHFAPFEQCALIIIMWVLLHGVFKLVGLRFNMSITYVNIFNDGMFNISMWVLPKFVLVHGFIMQVLYVMYIGTIGILYHDMGIVMGILSYNIDFKGTMYVLHFEFLFNDECLWNYKFSWCKNLSYLLQSWEGF
jgi:hypothetical protein